MTSNGSTVTLVTVSLVRGPSARRRPKFWTVFARYDFRLLQLCQVLRLCCAAQQRRGEEAEHLERLELASWRPQSSFPPPEVWLAHAMLGVTYRGGAIASKGGVPRCLNDSMRTSPPTRPDRVSLLNEDDPFEPHVVPDSIDTLTVRCFAPKIQVQINIG